MCIAVGIDDDLFGCQGDTQGGEVGKALAVYDEAVEGVAHADAAGLGIFDDGGTLGDVTSNVEVGVADACTGLDDGDLGIVAHIVDEGAAAARDDEVDKAYGMEQGGCGLTV